MTRKEYFDLVEEQVAICVDELENTYDSEDNFEVIDSCVHEILKYEVSLENLTLVEAAQIVEEYAKHVCQGKELWKGLELSEALKTQAWYSLKQDIVLEIKNKLISNNTIQTIKKSFYKARKRDEHSRKMHPDERIGG